MTHVYGERRQGLSDLLHEIYYRAIDTRATSVTPGQNDLAFGTMNLVGVSGVIIDERRHWILRPSDELPEHSTVSDIIDSSGEWSGCATSRDGDRSRYLIFGDHAGYAPIFFSLVPGKALITSDSFNGVVHGLSALQAPISLNFSNYLTLLTGRTATFDTLISNETMANEISILGPGEALVVDHERVSVIDRQTLSHSSQIDSYEVALDAAIKNASSTVSQFVSQNQNMQPLLTLTGGVDSRLVFALLSTTPYLRDFRIWTMDPRKAKSSYQKKVYTADVEISNQIRKAYKLEWMLPRDREKISLSFEESLVRHQSYYSNFSFKFAPSTHLALEAAPILTLRGGGGELLRGTGGARLTSERYRDYRKNGGKLEQVRWAASDYLDRSYLTDDLYPIADDFLIKQLNKYTSVLLREKLDSYYRDTRNRAHFGHHRSSASVNDHLTQVLSSPYFQRLTELAGYEYLSASGLVSDIFKLTNPKLRTFPFENSVAHYQLHVSTRKPFRYKDRDSWIEDFDAMEARRSSMAYRLLERPEERLGVSISKDEGTPLTFLRRGFNVIESLVGNEHRRKLATQHQRVLQLVKRERLNVGKVVAKVASALDIVAPVPLDGARHFFTDYGSSPQIPPRNCLQDAAVPYAEFIRAPDY